MHTFQFNIPQNFKSSWLFFKLFFPSTESTVGEIVNLMSVDVQRCTEFAQFAYFLWSGPFIIGLSVYFLWGILGPASLAGLFVMVLMLPVNAIIAGKIRKLQVTQMKKKDERVKLMNEMLSGIKVLKLYAWEPCFEKQITEIRHVELDVLKKTAFLNAYSNVLWTCSPFLVAISTFGTYVLLSEENVLDAHKIFVSLSLFNAMSVPLTFLVSRNYYFRSAERKNLIFCICLFSSP